MSNNEDVSHKFVTNQEMFDWLRFRFQEIMHNSDWQNMAMFAEYLSPEIEVSWLEGNDRDPRGFVVTVHESEFGEWDDQPDYVQGTEQPESVDTYLSWHEKDERVGHQMSKVATITRMQEKVMNVTPQAIGRIVVDVFDDNRCSMEFTSYASHASHGSMGGTLKPDEVGNAVQQRVVEMLGEELRDAITL